MVIQYLYIQKKIQIKRSCDTRNGKENTCTMRKKLVIGITYDVKEDYGLSSDDWKHCDFSTLSEINYIKKILEGRGHIVHLIGNYQKLYLMLQNNNLPALDIVMNTAEGINSRNREGWIPSLLEMNNIPYSGSDAYALGLTLNKLHTKIIAEYLNIPTPPYLKVDSVDDTLNVVNTLQGPWILKPILEGSSSGVMLAYSFDELKAGIENLQSKYHQSLLCETYIKGREYNVSLLYDGDKTKIIGTVEIIRKDLRPIEVFNVIDKFTGTCKKVPAVLEESVLHKMEGDTKKLHQYIGCYDYNRADFRVDSAGQHYLLELNPLPNLDDESAFYKCCEYGHLKLGKVLEEIFYNALLRYKKQHSSIL